MLNSIDVSGLKKIIGSVNIIDIREEEEYNDSHIKSSINVPNAKLMLYPERYLTKLEKYYIYCQFGKTSIKTCMYLNKIGYNVINIIGGYDNLSKKL